MPEAVQRVLVVGELNGRHTHQIADEVAGHGGEQRPAGQEHVARVRTEQRRVHELEHTLRTCTDGVPALPPQLEEVVDVRYNGSREDKRHEPEIE